MWTHSWMETLRFIPSRLSFIRRNFRFSVHHFAASRYLRRAMGCYAKKRECVPNNICKVGLKLTTTCNLKCDMCYQWRPGGLHNVIEPAYLRLQDCKNLLEFLSVKPCDVVLWGGEPLIAPDFDGFVEELCMRGSWCYICTNGVLIGEHIDVFERHSDRIAFLVALDGPKSVHDRIRGNGNFQRTVSNLTELVRKKRQGRKWLIGVECTIMPSNVSYMQEILKLCEHMQIDWMVFNHLWIIADSAKEEYRMFCKKFTGIEPLSITGFDSQFSDATYVDDVVRKCSIIKHSKASIPVLFSPDLSPECLRRYYYGTLTGPSSYLKLGVKLDIEANGDVVAFKLFPDVVLGNIYHQNVPEILASNQYQHVAQYLSSKGLAICNSCPDFYNLGGIKR